MGVKVLRRIQLGRETTPGTPVAATTILRANGATIEDDTLLEFPDENIALLVPTTRVARTAVGAKLAISDMPATFEQLPYVLAGAIRNIVSGTADGGGSGRIYTYNFSTISPNPITTFTIEAGNDVQAERMEYSFVREFALSGAPKSVIKISSDWYGRQATNVSFTGSLSVPTVEEIIFQGARLFIDNENAIGTTLRSNTLLGFNLSVTTGWKEQFCGDGTLHFSFIKHIGGSGTLEVTFEHNSIAVAEKTNWRNRTIRAVRLLIEGSNLGTAGPGYTRKTLRIDGWGVWEKFDVLDEQDGNDIVKGTLRLGYSSVATKMLEITVVNELASLP